MRCVIVLALLLGGGCTTQLKVRPIDGKVETTRVGAPYSVPFTQYTIEVTREVVGCGNNLKVKTGAEIKSAELRRDPKLRFALDTDSLASSFKTSDVKLDYDSNGVVTALNATAEDRTAQVIGNIVSSVAKIASIAAASGAGGARAEACSPETLAALADVQMLRPGVKTATAAVTARTEALKALQTKAAALGANIDEGTKDKISKAYDALAASTEELAQKSKALEKPLKAISEKQVIRWPQDGDTFHGEITMDDLIFAKFGRVDDDPSERRRFSIFLTLSPLVAGGRDVTVAAAASAKLGVPFRSPEPGRVVVCAERPCAPGVEILAEKVGEVAQLGPIYYLNCTSRAFSSVGCSFAMASDGTLKSIGSVRKTASAEVLTGAVSSNLDTLSTLQGTLSTAKQKQFEKATALAKAEADYEATVKALAGDPNADVIALTATAKANAEYALAQKAEADARAALEQTLATTGVAKP